MLKLKLKSPDDMAEVEKMLEVWRGGNTETAGSFSAVNEAGETVEITLSPLEQ